MNYATLEECCTILDHQRIPIKKSERKEGMIPYYGANGLQGYINDYIFDDDLVLLAEDGGAFGSETTPIAYRVSGKCWVNNHAHVLKPKSTVNVDYLCYALMFYPVNSLITGTTRKKLTQAAMRKMRIPLRSLSEQERIARLLKKIEHTINECTLLQKDLDQLVKSQFVELFGEPVMNPKGWERSSIRDTSELISDGPFGSHLKSSHYVAEGIRVIRLSNIGAGRFLDDDKAYISEEHYATLKKYTCHAGEIVIGTLGEPNLRACLIPENIATSVNKSDCVHFIPKSGLLNNTYACAYLNTEGALQLAQGSLHGQTRSRIAMSQVAALPIMLPPHALQNEFAAFVEQIDKSEFLLRQLLEKQQTLKKSLMQEYFS